MAVYKEKDDSFGLKISKEEQNHWTISDENHEFKKEDHLAS